MATIIEGAPEATTADPTTPVAKAFFDTKLGRGCAALLTAGGIYGTNIGIAMGDPLLAGSSAMLLTNAFAVALNVHRFAPYVFPLFSLAASPLAADKALSVQQDQIEQARIQTLPTIHRETLVPVPVASLVCLGKKGWVEARTSQHVVGKVDCGL